MNSIINGLNTAFDDEGKGYVVLMLHGWGSDRQSFALLARQLTPEYRVLRVDLPGFGESEQPKQAWHIHDYAAFVASFLKKRKITELYAVIGHSMGGRIALQALGRDVISAERLVLIGSHGIKQSANLRNTSYKAVAKTGKVASKVLPKTLQNRLRSKLYSQAGADDYLHAGSMKATFKNIITTDAQQDAASVTADTLLVYGAKDDQTPPAFGERFHTLIPRSRLEVIEAAGHFTHVDKPAEVTRLIKDFLV